MKPFRFRLEKVLAWRRTELEVEQHKTRLMAAALEETARALARLAVERTSAEQSVAGTASMLGAELAAHSAYLARLARQERDIEARRQQQEKSLAEQHSRLMEARRRCRLLEKLRARKHEEWEAETNRELEQFAAESHLVRWNAGQR